MVHIIEEFDVRCPRELAVPYLADFENAVEWDPGTVECTRIGVPGAPVEVGSRWHNVSKVLGRTTELTYELVSLRDDGVVFEGSNSTAHTRDDIGLEVVDNARTRVRYEATITFTGMARFADPLMSLVFRKVARDTVRDLTAALERLPRP
ncbi:polyketide cyclase/dehydrase/lipid transport protein [Knoellia remsis]|uniref:Polyketide cyclase/dehydrase/lipid transport protein n=1 Tax=Knoellia remsis TaxID=407159 RepID=A0A2T0UGG9_9MICO|nr:SRPBCC family protein [Knoellia remsis]PRY57045.1 polyketide cyclase/dehydrase/lipid transport protein [Knoellia remsis]